MDTIDFIVWEYSTAATLKPLSLRGFSVARRDIPSLKPTACRIKLSIWGARNAGAKLRDSDFGTSARWRPSSCYRILIRCESPMAFA